MTTAFIAPKPAPTSSNKMATITPMLSFYGDYEKGEEPTTWFLRSWEVWFQTLTAADTVTWIAFSAAFARQWPPPAHVTLTPAQQKDRIRAITLKDEDIRRLIEKDRGRK
ncbi:hypothetical protein F4604DRAFT_1934170 [Suillus subluteus]|nr:hypothetical protein F4604DRAFT_1934170 [Suillus subluteus]